MKIRILKHPSSAISIKSQDSGLNHTQNFINPLCMRELFYFPLTQPSPSRERALKQEKFGSKPSPEGCLQGCRLVEQCRSDCREGWVRGNNKHVIPISYLTLVSGFIKPSLLSVKKPGFDI